MTTAAVALGLGNVDLSKGPVVAVVSGGNVAPEAFAKYVSITEPDVGGASNLLTCVCLL